MTFDYSAILEDAMLLSLPAVQRELGGIGLSTLRTLIREGRLPVVRVRRRVFVAKPDLQAFIKRTRQASR